MDLGTRRRISPPLPHLDSSASQNAALTLLVTWSGYVSYNKPPEQIIVEVFSVPDGSRLGSFTIPGTEDIRKSEKTCEYRTSVEVEDFPAGSFMLIAADPLSGATNRQTISIPPHNKGNIDFFKQSEHEQMFLLSSVMPGAFLAVLLAILLRKKI